VSGKREIKCCRARDANSSDVWSSHLRNISPPICRGLFSFSMQSQRWSDAFRDRTYKVLSAIGEELVIECLKSGDDAW